jgi:RimJ/RimL family protein N-acetyltransferase
MTAVANVASQAVMQRLGLSLSTYFDHPAVASSSPVCRHVLYSITDATYRGAHS